MLFSSVALVAGLAVGYTLCKANMATTVRASYDEVEKSMRQKYGYANQVLMQFPNCVTFYGGLSIVYILPYIEPEWIKYEENRIAKQEERKRLKLEKKIAKRV